MQPFHEVDAGPNLPQPLKTKDEGADYYYGRGVREAPDVDVSLLRFGGQDLPRTDVMRERVDKSIVGDFEEAPHPEAASSSAGAERDTLTKQWLTEALPSSQPDRHGLPPHLSPFDFPPQEDTPQADATPQTEPQAAQATPPSWTEATWWWSQDAWAGWQPTGQRGASGGWSWHSSTGWKWE